MASIWFSCSSCQREMKAPEEFAGRTAHCPQCKREMVVPEPFPALNSSNAAPLSPETPDESEGHCPPFSKAHVQFRPLRQVFVIIAVVLTFGAGVCSLAWLGKGEDADKSGAGLKESQHVLPSSRGRSSQGNKKTEEPKQQKDQLQRQSAKRAPLQDPDGRAVPMTETRRQEIVYSLHRIINKRPPSEPLAMPKGWKWTEEKYKPARLMALHWQSILEGNDKKGPTVLGDFHTLAKIPRITSGWVAEMARELLPCSIPHWEREGHLDAMRMGPKLLDHLISYSPYLSALKDDDYYSYLKKRAGREERRALYNRLCEITEDERPWSLHHPFDDLNRRQMERVAESARLASETCPALVRGERVSPLPKEDFDLLIQADQIEFLIALFAPPEERQRAREEREKKRAAARGAIRKAQGEEIKRENERALAVERKRVLDEQEAKARKLLRPALQLDARGGFDKRVIRILEEIVEKYPETPSGKKAAQKLRKMRGQTKSTRMRNTEIRASLIENLLSCVRLNALGSHPEGYPRLHPSADGHAADFHGSPFCQSLLHKRQRWRASM